jgi:putative DNA primase/helicase
MTPIDNILGRVDGAIQRQPGQHRTACPNCGRGAKDKTLGLKIESDGSGVAHCFRCGYTESRHPERGSVQRAPSLKLVGKPDVKQHTTLSDWGRELWGSTQELSGIAEDYLMARHCCLPPRYGDLRWHPALKHPSGYVGAALVALITDIHPNAPLSLHRTWITPTGKAAIDTPRLLLGNHSIDGGVIRLWPDDEVVAILGIAEGIETALSLAWAPMPVWAAIDAGHLAKFPLLDGIQTLVIAQDNDPAGIAAAGTCAARWTLDLKQVLVTRQEKNDVNDELVEVANEI